MSGKHRGAQCCAFGWPKRKKKEARSNSEGSSDDESSLKRQGHFTRKLFFVMVFMLGQITIRVHTQKFMAYNIVHGMVSKQNVYIYIYIYIYVKKIKQKTESTQEVKTYSKSVQVPILSKTNIINMITT